MSTASQRGHFYERDRFVLIWWKEAEKMYRQETKDIEREN